LSFSRGDGVKDVHFPFRKGPWGEYGMELLLLLMDEVTMFLTWYAYFNKCVAVFLHGWPKVAGFEYFVGHGSCARIVSAYSFMEFPHYVLSLFCCKTFE